MKTLTRIAPLALLFSGGCSDDVEVPEGCHTHGDELHCPDDDHGLATRLILSFTPSDGGDTLSFTWSDPEDDGDPIVDDILLPDGSDTEDHVARTWTVDVEVWNDLESPAEDVTVEIADQADAHQFFFTGSAVSGPASDSAEAVVEHAYADQDADGLPVGLENTFTTLALGSGELVVTLRHMPVEDGNPVKTDGLAEDVLDGGFGAIGGSTDIDVRFNLEVE